MSREIKVHFLDEGLAVTSWDNLLLNRWYGAPDVDRIQRLWDVQAAFRDGLPDRRQAVISIFESSAGLRMSEPARRRATQLAADMEDSVICLGQIVRGTGFFSSITRSIVSGVMLLSRASYPSQVFADVEPCAKWMVGPWRGQTGSLEEVELLRRARALDVAAGAGGTTAARAG